VAIKFVCIGASVNDISSNNYSNSINGVLVVVVLVVLVVVVVVIVVIIGRTHAQGVGS